MNINEVGCYLLNKRKEKGITQNELADLLNVSHQAVSRWERGENLPDVLKLIELSKLYNVTVDEILAEGNSEIKIDIKENKENGNYIIFTILNIVLSSIGLLLFYLLVLNGMRLSIAILIHYTIGVGSSLLFVLPYTLNVNRTQRMFRLMRVNIVISTMLLLLPLFGVVTGLGYGYLHFLPVTLDILFGYILYNILVSIEENIFTSNVNKKYTVMYYMSSKRIIEYLLAIVFSALVTILVSNVFQEEVGVVSLSMVSFLMIVVVYKIIREVNFISLLQILPMMFSIYTLFWWNSIQEVLSGQEYLEYLNGIDESILIVLTISFLVIIFVLLFQMYKYKSRFLKFKSINIMLLSLNFIILITYHMIRPQFYIRRITESQGGSSQVIENYIMEFTLNNRIPFLLFFVFLIVIIIVADEIRTLHKRLNKSAKPI